MIGELDRVSASCHDDDDDDDDDADDDDDNDIAQW